MKLNKHYLFFILLIINFCSNIYTEQIINDSEIEGTTTGFLKIDINIIDDGQSGLDCGFDGVIKKGDNTIYT